MPARTDSRARAVLLLAAILVFAAVCLGRLGYWQVVRHAELLARARDQVTMRVEIPSERGTIYDRSGTVALATSVSRDRLVAFPRQLAGASAEETSVRSATATRLATILGLDADGARALRERIDSGRAYVVLARDLTAAESAAVRAAMDGDEVSQVRLEPEAVRVYPLEGGAPDTTLAAQLLGFVNRGGGGQYGVEERWQEALAGAPQVLLAERDASGEPNLASAQSVEPGSPGADLTLTIDASLQLALEREVYAAWVADRAKRVSAVVMSPSSGEILAQATYPAYDGNAYQAAADEDPGIFLDPVVSAVYEPGSVFKMVTAVAVLQAGVVTRTSRVQDQSILRLDGGRAFVTNADRASKKSLSFQDAIAWSRNVVMAKVALDLGRTTGAAARSLYETWTTLGFGSRTDVDLAGEVAGIARDPAAEAWREIDLANGSFGQGVAVTLLQLATAYSAMVNGGVLPTPHVVSEVGTQPVTVADRGRALSSALSADLVRILKRVPKTVPAYREGTLIPGYVVGGKTGTAQIWDADKGRWKPNVFNFSFIGFVGRESPEVVVAVRIRGGATDSRSRGADRAAGGVVRAVSAHRDGRDEHPRPAPPPGPRWGIARPDGPMNPACGTLPAVTTEPAAPGAADAPRSAPLTADELVAATGGDLLRRSTRVVRGGAVDSRRVEPGNLFVALRGERTDGHRHLESAVAAGAAALLVTDPLDPARLADLGDVTVVRVRDGLAGLHAVAAAWRARFAPLVVGITGSVGKTSTKEATAAVLGTAMRTLKSEGNQNNEIGVPLTLLRLDEDHRAAVLEMGMYVGGEISTLAALGRPSVGIVTAVAPVHLERAGSIEAIENAKAELVEALPPEGTAILNADDVRVGAFRSRTVATVVTYGLSPGADVTAATVDARGAAGMAFDVVARAPRRARFPVRISALGRHSVQNSLAAAAVGLLAGVADEQIAAGLALPWARASEHRGVLVETPDLLILDDTYNASPPAVIAALDVLASLSGRPVAVLGEMLELGSAAERNHREVGAAAAGVVAELVVVGAAAGGIAAGAAAAGLDEARIHTVAGRDEALAVLRAVLQPGDAVLVKASRGAALESIVAALRGGTAGPARRRGAGSSTP